MPDYHLPGSKRNRISLVVLLVILLGALGWLVLRPPEREPLYQDKPLSFWLEGYDSGNYNLTHPRGPSPPTWTESDEAIRRIGTNAVPIFLRMLRQKDSKLKVAINQLQNLVKIPLTPVNQNFKAFQGFMALGATASNAVPRLSEIFDGDASAFPQQAVPAILGFIGPAAGPAIPSLLRAITHTNGIVRNNAVFALGRIHRESELVVPALIKCLNDPDAQVRTQAARALGALGKDAQPAVPALLELWRKESRTTTNGAGSDFETSVSSSWNTSPFGSGIPNVVGATKHALQSIDPEAAAKAKVK